MAAGQKTALTGRTFDLSGGPKRPEGVKLIQAVASRKNAAKSGAGYGWFMVDMIPLYDG